MKILKAIFVWSVLLIMISCSGNQEKAGDSSTLEDLFEVDRAFSKLSEETSIGEAFLFFAAEDAVILRENRMPIVGRTDISYLFEDVDGSVKLTWEPLDGDIANSGDIGYTYGTWELKNDTIVSRGTYVSIWKKQSDSEWRYVLDTGNEGLGN